MIARLRLPRSSPRVRRSARAYCEADNWSFDSRYTQGKCPICGWQPEGAPNAPDWLALVNRVDWQIVGLFLLVDVLFAQHSQLHDRRLDRFQRLLGIDPQVHAEVAGVAVFLREAVHVVGETEALSNVEEEA